MLEKEIKAALQKHGQRTLVFAILGVIAADIVSKYVFGEALKPYHH